MDAVTRNEGSQLRDFLKSKRFFFLVLFWHFILYIVLYFNVSSVRQIIAFIYLAYFPGSILLKMLRFERLETEEEILFTVGLSVAFLMFFGLLLNELLPIIGILEPLTLKPILLSISFVLLLFSYFIPSHINILPDFSNLSRLSKFSICLPMIGLLGIFTLSAFGENFVLILLIFIVCGLVIVSVSRIQQLTSKDISIIILAIAFALFFGLNVDLLNGYVHGPGDQPIEYYAFKLTEMNSRWYSGSVPSSDLGMFPVYSMASVTILPSIFSVFLGVQSEWVIFILYTFIVSFVPLSAYLLYKRQTNITSAFIATFFLATVAIGKSWGPARQMAASLFFEMLILIILEKKFSPKKHSLLFITFSSALVISHYSLSYIFLYLMLFTWVIPRILKKEEKISTTLVITFAAICFSWYIFVTASATFDNFVNALNMVLSKATTQFWSLEARGSASKGVGLFLPTSTINQISGIFFYISEGFIFVGFIKLLFKRNETKLSFLYKVIIFASMCLIFLNILIPGLADTFLMERFFITAVMVIAPLFVLGGETIAKLIPKLKMKESLAIPFIMMVLIPLFLFQTGTIYVLFKDYTTSIIGINGWDETTRYLTLSNYHDVNGAKWLLKHADADNLVVYSDWPAKYSVLTAYGFIDRNHIQTLSNVTKTVEPKSFIYLTNFNNQVGLLLIEYPYNITEISDLLDGSNPVYSNGNCIIYR